MLPSTDSSDKFAALRCFSAGLSERNISVLHQDENLVYDLVENLPRTWPMQHPIGSSDADGEDWAASWIAAKRDVLKTGRPRSVELYLSLPSGRRVFEATLKPDLDETGAARGVITVLSDTTELRDREIALTGLMREVSHRSKNLLAIVQSIAAQTAHHSDNMTDFLAKFRGRLQALASIQDLVTDSDWRGTLFRSLVAAQLDRVGETAPERVRVTGDNPMLGPNAALHVGLALHELLSNARRYGALALSKPGTIRISSHLVTLGEQRPELVIEWLESKLANRPAATVPRFGSTVLKKIVPLSVGGSAEHELGQDGLSYRLRVPAGHYET